MAGSTISTMSIGLGLIGFGFIGRIHARAFAADPRAHLVAIADSDPDCLKRAAGGNLPEVAEVEPVREARHYRSAEKLLADPDIEAVVVCVPTPLHPALAAAALEAGKHVLVEKPLATRAVETGRVLEAAARHPDQVCMPAHCMRFWPGWSWVHEAIRDGRYGAVLGATFSRLGYLPDWGQAFYSDPTASGSAILDLHIHDADFIRYCFGEPMQVQSAGWKGATGGVDHVVTRYRFAGGPPLVVAEGGWLTGRLPFRMHFRVSFEQAVAEFLSEADPPLRVYAAEGEGELIEASRGDGYAMQAAHFLDRVERKPVEHVVCIEDGVAAVRLVEAERRSVETGLPVAPVEVETAPTAQ